MTIENSTIRDLCTEAVYERGETYREERRIKQLDRVGETITARVQGTELYETRVALDSPDFAPRCTCPYSGPGECKHVIAVLLAVAAEMPADQSENIDALLTDISAEDLQEFLRGELTRDPELRERFLAEFGGDEASKSADEY